MIAPLAWVLDNGTNEPEQIVVDDGLAHSIRQAFGHHGYLLLTLGFFVCGFHVAFIAIHLPTYVQDLGLAAHVGAYAIAIIGFFNIGGSLLSGLAGQRWSKKYGLSFIYFARAITIAALLAAPKTELTIYGFAAVMGILWLSTVPLTSGIVAQVFGVRYMSTLFGIVFVSHQVGSFLGVWLGGYVYDRTGTYDAVWWIGVGLGIAATALHLPIDERPLARVASAASS